MSCPLFLLCTRFSYTENLPQNVPFAITKYTAVSVSKSRNTCYKRSTATKYKKSNLHSIDCKNTRNDFSIRSPRVITKYTAISFRNERVIIVTLHPLSCVALVCWLVESNSRCCSRLLACCSFVCWLAAASIWCVSRDWKGHDERAGPGCRLVYSCLFSRLAHFLATRRNV
jgi:hypothetical protein